MQWVCSLSVFMTQTSNLPPLLTFCDHFHHVSTLMGESQADGWKRKSNKGHRKNLTLTTISYGSRTHLAHTAQGGWDPLQRLPHRPRTLAHLYHWVFIPSCWFPLIQALFCYAYLLHLHLSWYRSCIISSRDLPTCSFLNLPTMINTLIYLFSK